MKHFENCKTIEEVRNLYRDLAKVNHPDLGGDTKVMQEINVEYAKMTSVFTRANNPEETEMYYRDMENVEEELRKVLVELLKLDGLKVEICGVWIWVSGETKQHKEALKELGLKWAHKKLMWYFAGVPSYNKGRTYSMNHIRTRYGSQVVVKDKDAVMA